METDVSLVLKYYYTRYWHYYCRYYHVIFITNITILITTVIKIIMIIIIMADFIIQKTIFYKYNYEPSGLGNYTIYGVYAKK